MNRYVIAGALADAKAGKRVVLVGTGMSAYLGLVDHAPEVKRIMRANGNERMDFTSGGSIRLLDHRRGGITPGLVADVIFLDADAAHTPRVLESAHVAAAACNGEVIRA